MSKVVTHQHIWKPAICFPGGVVGATLCGVQSEVRAAECDLNVAEGDKAVTCKNCLAILSGKRVRYGKDFVGMSWEHVEAISLARAEKKSN